MQDIYTLKTQGLWRDGFFSASLTSVETIDQTEDSREDSDSVRDQHQNKTGGFDYLSGSVPRRRVQGQQHQFTGIRREE